MKLEDVPVKDLKLSIIKTTYGRFQAQIRYGGKLKQYIGSFDTEDECYKAFNECKYDFSKRFKYYVERRKPISESKKREIINYFWNNIENTDPTIAKLFKIEECEVRLILDKEVNEHFKRVNKRINAS